MYGVFFYSALFIGIIPLLILFLKRGAFKIKAPVIPFIWLTALASSYELIGTDLLRIDTFYWFQIYALLEYATIFYFFYQLFKTVYLKSLLLFSVLFVITYLSALVFGSIESKFIALAVNKIPITLFVLTFSFRWYQDLFKRMEVEHLWKDPVFGFVSGISFYYASTLFLFLLSGFIFNHNLYEYWLVNIIATSIMRLFLIISVWHMNMK